MKLYGGTGCFALAKASELAGLPRRSFTVGRHCLDDMITQQPVAK
jgi:hypothetical protein